MADKPFFPDPVFAWSFFVAIAVLTAIAAYIDTRKAIVPKWLTIGMLIAGFPVNMVRAALLASQNKPLWLLDTGSVGLGVLDGFLFSLCGFVLAFGLFVGMWMLGLCGGGDVKLFAALGAWFGLLGILYLFLLSVAALWCWVFAVLVSRGGSLKKMRKANIVNTKKGKKTDAEKVADKPLRVTYSTPIAVAAIILMLLLFRPDLGLPPWNL